MSDPERGTTRLPAELRADCARCVGLCCVVPAFYSVQGFAFDKPAHTPCRHLTQGNRCAIHSRLASRGFPGCVAFDCYGAGQRVTQAFLRGTDWRSSQRSAAETSGVYSTTLALHKLMALLFLAAADLDPPDAAALHARRAVLDALCLAPEALSGTLDVARVEAETLELVKEARRDRPVPGAVGDASATPRDG